MYPCYPSDGISVSLNRDVTMSMIDSNSHYVRELGVINLVRLDTYDMLSEVLTK